MTNTHKHRHTNEDKQNTQKQTQKKTNIEEQTHITKIQTKKPKNLA